MDSGTLTCELRESARAPGENQKLKHIVANLPLDKQSRRTSAGKHSRAGAHQDLFIGELVHECPEDAERRGALLGHSAF